MSQTRLKSKGMSVRMFQVPFFCGGLGEGEGGSWKGTGDGLSRDWGTKYTGERGSTCSCAVHGCVVRAYVLFLRQAC